MESCHSVAIPAIEIGSLKTSNSYPVNPSLGNLLKVLEQLRIKDRIISHLEKELGLHPGYALQLHVDKDQIQEQFSLAKMAGTTKQQSNQSSNSSSSTRNNDGTKNNSLLSKSMELEANLNKLEEKNISLSKENGDLIKKLKEMEQKIRPLHEKNCKFLEKNMELVTSNRSLQDNLTSLTEEHKKLREQADHSRKRACLLSRQLSQEKMEQGTLEIKLEELKKQLSEQTHTTNTLKQACTEKDRRIEVIQHRKKRKKLNKCHDKNIGVKETFFGFDEDKQTDSDTSTPSSLSYGTTSDDEICDELSRKEIEKNYQHLMREHLELQKSYTLLQSLSDSCLDPQRENKVKTQLETDLFVAACRIEKLENELKERQPERPDEWDQKEALLHKVKRLEDQEDILKEELREAREMVDNLEFQVLELDECQDREHVDKCDVAVGTDNKDEDRSEECIKTSKLNGVVSELQKSEAFLNLHLEMAGKVEEGYKREVENLRQQLSSLLEGRGYESEILIDKIRQLKEAEQKCMTLEKTAADLQEKVICLQKEKSVLEEKQDLLRSKLLPGLTDEEQKEILSLKKKLQISEKSEIQLMEKFAKLQIDLETAETKNKVLRKKLLTLEDKVDSSVTEKNSDDFVDHSTQTNIIEIFKASAMEKDDRTSTSSTLMINSEDGHSEVSVDENEDPFGRFQSELSDLQEENYLLKSEILEKSFNEDDRGDRNCIESKMEELNIACDNLQEKVNDAEISERQLREKLKLAERTINDLESSEGLVREKCDELISRENGFKRQIESLQHNCKELKEIILDKEAFEQKVQEKVNVLEEAETVSNQKISELQASNQMLQHRIDLKEEIEADIYLLETLKQQLSLSESQNRDLQAKVSELEENEQILRENWLAVAEEEAKEKDCLKEKVKMLNLLNHELKFKIQEDQENAVVTKTSELSLASELSASGLSSDANCSIEMLQETNAQLEEQLQKIEDEKNSVIERLEEKIGQHSENEVKLSETLMEMEHAENELKAKLALYENSAVTVDKILKYEDKIYELRSSQENLLDRLDSMEDHEDSLKEKLMKSEQKYEGKILMLEKEIYKHLQMEEVFNSQIKSMEDNEKSLKEKIDSLNSFNMDLQKEKDELVEKGDQEVSEKFHNIEMEKIDLKAKLSNMEQDYQDLLNKCDTKDEKKNKNEQQLKKSKQRIKELSAENEKLNQKIVDLQSLLENIQEELEQWKNKSSELKRMKTKLDVLEEAETKLMERVVELEDVEHTLTEELEETKQQLNLSKQRISTSSPTNENFSKQFSDKCVATELFESSPVQKSESRTVTGLFERSKDLEAENHELSEKVGNLLAAEAQVKQLSEKVKLLEQSEEQLMERVIELEDEEDRLKGELSKVRRRSSSADKEGMVALLEEKEQIIAKLEEEKSAIHRDVDILTGKQTETEFTQQMSDLKAENNKLEEKIVEYGYEVSDLTDKMEQFESMYFEEKAKNDLLQKNKNDASDSPKPWQVHKELENELLTTQEKLEEIQTEYELRLSEMEDYSKEFKEELNSQMRENEVLKLKIKELEKAKSELIDELEIFQDSESELLSKQHELLSRTVDLESKINFLESQVEKGEDKNIEDAVNAINVNSGSDVIQIDSLNPGASEDSWKTKDFDTENGNKSNSDISVLLTEKEDYLIRAKSYLSQIEKLEEENKLSDERIDKLNVCVSDLESKLESDMEIIEDMRTKENEYVFKLQELEQQNDANLKDLEIMRNSNNEYISEIELLNQKVDVLDNLKTENENNFEQIQNAESEKSELLRSIEKLSAQDIENKSKVSVLKNTISVLQNNMDELSMEKMECESKLMEIETELEIFRSKCANSIDQSSQTHDSEIDVNSDDYSARSKRELIELINLLEKENKEEKLRMLELSERLEAFQNAVNEVTTMVIEEETVETEKKVETFHKLTRIQGIPEAFQRKLKDLVKNNQDMKNRLSKLQQKESSLRRSVDKLEESHRREIEEFKKEIDRLTDEKNRLLSTNSSPGYRANFEQSQKPSICEEKVLHSKELISTVELENIEPSLQCSDNDRGALVTSPVIERQNELWLEIENLHPNKALLQQENTEKEGQRLQEEVERLQQSETTLKEKVQKLEGLVQFSCTPDLMMLEKSEGLLKRRIMELEKIEGHLKQQVSDLEQDREELHEIARKDKDIIHKQNVCIRELQLCEKNLKEQLNHFEISERSLFEKVADLERQLSKLEDRVKTLQIHEVRLKELVEKYKLDEEVWLMKSGDLESSMHELSATESALKRKINEVENENSGMSEKMEYMKLRLEEMEDSEKSLNQRVEKHEELEISLQNQLAELENYESNLQTQVSELHAINTDLVHRINHAMEENSVLSHQIAQLQQQQHALNQELSVLHDSEITLKLQVESLQKNNFTEKQDSEDYELKNKLQENEQTDSITKAKIRALQRNENRLMSRIHELETSGTQAMSELSASQREKLPKNLEECQKRIVQLQNENSQFQKRLLKHQQALSNGRVVQISRKDYLHLQARVSSAAEMVQQMKELEHINECLKLTVAQLREGKDVCGHEAEMDTLKQRLVRAHISLQRLRKSLSDRQCASGVEQGDIELLPEETVSTVESDCLNLGPTEGKVAISMSAAPVGSRNRQRELFSTIEEEPHYKVSSNLAYTGPHRLSVKEKPSMYSYINHFDTSDVDDVQLEEVHWKAIESHRPEARGQNNEHWVKVAEATSFPSGLKNPGNQKVEELVIGVTLPSENESAFNSQNDTDSNFPSSKYNSGKLLKQFDGSLDSQPPPLPSTSPPPLEVSKTTDSFVESYYVGNVQEVPLEGVSTNTRDARTTSHKPISWPLGSMDSVPDSGRDTCSIPSVTRRTSATVTMQDRIAQIEHHLQHRPALSKDTDEEDGMFAWRRKALENGQGLETAQSEVRSLREEINKLEKQLEEKNRYILILEVFIDDIEKLIQEQDPEKQSLVKGLQKSFSQLQFEVKEAGLKSSELNRDPAALHTELNKKERELATKRIEIDNLMQELHQWQEECRTVEDMRSHALDSLRCLEMEIEEHQNAEKDVKYMNDEYNKVQRIYDEMEEAKNKALMSVAPLKAKVSRLTQKCKEKDELLRRLGSEVRNLKMSAKPLSLLEELGQLEASLADDQVNRSPSSPSSLGMLEDMRSVSDGMISRRTESRSRNQSLSGSSFSDTDQHSHVSDSELLHEPVAMPQQRARSADLFDRRHQHSVTANQNRSLDHLPQLNGTSTVGPRKHSGISPGHMPNNPDFIAVADYHPEYFSQSGRPNLELSLKEGDQVLITGPLDARGYYEAVVNGKNGLAPASHIQPASHVGPKLRRQKKLQSVPLHLDPSPEKILQMHNQLQLSHTPRRQLPQKPVGKSVKLPKVLTPEKSPKGRKSDKSAKKVADGNPGVMVNGHDFQSRQSSPRTRQPKKIADARRSILQGPPAPPTQFHVDKVMSENSIMLSWKPPFLDGQNYNNGCQVTGYKILMNGQQCHQANSPHSKKAVVQNVDLSRPQRFGIQTMSLGGTVSKTTEFIFEGVEILSSSPSDGVSDVEIAPAQVSSIYETGDKRTFMGVYDYSPLQQSPRNHTSSELTIQTGDVITVYGRERPDGFYHGEINGRRGLVPASFIEEVPSSTSGFKQTSPHKQQRTENKTEKKEERRKSAGKKS